MSAFRPTVRRGFVSLMLHHYRAIILVPLCLTVLLAAVSIWQGRMADRVAREGLVAQSQVIAKDVEEAESGNAPDRHFLTLRFLPQSGEPAVEQRRRVSAEFFAAVSEGQSLPVTYAASRPTLFEVEPGSLMGASGGAALTVRFAGFATIMALGFAGFRVRGAIAARDQGRELPARVRRHKRYAGEWVSMLRLEWETADGRRGGTRLMYRPQAARYPVGSLITLREEPGGTRLWWEGDL